MQKDKTHLKEIASQMVHMLEDKDLSVEEAAEVAANVYGFVMHECGVSLHSAMGAVMEYYKKNADH